MRHRIVRVGTWVRGLFSRPVQAPSVALHLPPAAPATGIAPPRTVDELIDGDASRLVRPYVVSCERQARERARQLFAYDGQFSVYAA
ncbi:hypothetical protein C3486_26415 [Streptomyces sp. Ru73]|nr:hypothetical protein C3486_26415 [Streptomyces sp. Ru73]